MKKRKVIALIILAVCTLAVGGVLLLRSALQSESEQASYPADLPNGYTEANNQLEPDEPEEPEEPEEHIECETTAEFNGYEAPEEPQEEPYEPYFTSVITPVFTAEPLPPHIIEFITGVTFRHYTPFTTCVLAYLTVTHADFNGESVLGHLIVSAEIADEVLDIFREIYDAGFPIYSIRLIDYFDGLDYYSMAANNSSAFNFRYIAGTRVISQHGWGLAVDINPIQNPYIRGGTVLPAAGAAYLDRTYVRPGMITPGDAVYNAFTSRGWIWGGRWNIPRDYHHFERRVG